MCIPKRATVFGDYSQVHMLPYLQDPMTNSTKRVEAIWEMHTDASLKFQTHGKHGETFGYQIQVTANIPFGTPITELTEKRSK